MRLRKGLEVTDERVGDAGTCADRGEGGTRIDDDACGDTMRMRSRDGSIHLVKAVSATAGCCERAIGISDDRKIVHVSQRTPVHLVDHYGIAVIGQIFDQAGTQQRSRLKMFDQMSEFAMNMLGHDKGFLRKS